VPLTPDEKDWTWVLERPCPECGFDPATRSRDRFAGAVRDCATAWTAVLHRDGVQDRTDESRWSDLEYGCHVRDVCRIMDGRLASMLSEDDPTFANWDQDETAINERYGDQDPGVVSDELAAAADQFARHIDAIQPNEWSRPGTRSNGSRFTVETLVRYGLHDLLHHEWDVSRD
jgi:DinB superfamily